MSETENDGGRGLERVGVIDVGSNSVRLVVFDGAARSPAYFYNEKILCGLGKGIAESGRLNPEGRKRALAAIDRFALLQRSMKLQSLSSVATAAVREAADGPDFVAEVKARTGIALHVASGEEEARLSAQGVLLGWPDAKGIVCDIGGASMELAEVRDGKVAKCATSDLGPMKLMDVRRDQLEAHIRQQIAALKEGFTHPCEQLFLVGGSFRAIAKFDMERRGYPLKVLHEYCMHQGELRATTNWIDDLSTDEMQEETDTSAERLALVPLASKVLRLLVEMLAPTLISVSSYGIREGLLFERMAPEQRRKDPLIAACLANEYSAARFPGFGQVLYEWILPLFDGADVRQRRLIRAACLLHDVNWKGHPDYRAIMCFDSATRANLGGLGHQERIILGMSLMHRYTNSTKHGRFQDLAILLSEEELQLAERLGKAMRLGALLGDGGKRVLANIAIEGEQLTLRANEGGGAVFGEVVAKRLNGLAGVMKLEPKWIGQ